MDNRSTFAAMKYRRLHLEELEELKDEFIQFLAANSIPADEWKELKKTSPEKVNGLIEMFSDIFWDKALSKIECVEMREPKRVRVVRFDKEKASLIEVRLGASSTLDLTKGEAIQSLASGKIDPNTESPEMYTGERKYSSERNLELFSFIEQGAKPCKLVVWEAFKRMAGKA